jgi:hypothetical protein
MATVLLAAPCWALFALVVAVAWPIWHHANEYALFHRRAVLASVALDDSVIRRWLWRGHVVGALQAFDALFWAALLIAFGALLARSHWLLLAADAVVFAAMIPLVRRRLATQVRETHVAMVARRWPLLLGNVALLAVGFFVIDFFVAGAADTRGLAWFTVAENAFSAYAGKSECIVAGVLIGSINVASALVWHASQVLIPSLPRVELKLAAWLLALLKASVVSWAFTRLLLGASALVEAAALRRLDVGTRRRFPAPFVVAVTAVGVVLLVLAAILRGVDPSGMPKPIRNAVAWTNPCRAQTSAARSMQPALRAKVESARIDASSQADRQVDSAVAALFADAERNVDAYLDWYFSLIGEYQRLGAAITGDFAKSMQDELDRRILGELGVEPMLGDAMRSIAAESIARFDALAADVAGDLQQSLRIEPCLPEVIDTVALRGFERDRFRVAVAASGGIVAAIGVSAFAARAASAMAARLATRQGYRAAAGAAGKVASRRAGAVTLAAAAATACAPGGPLAALCALVAGAASWIAIDYTLVSIDELRFRGEMRAEILDAVRAAEQQLAADLKAQQQALIERLAASAAESIDRVFVPARQGL